MLTTMIVLPGEHVRLEPQGACRINGEAGQLWIERRRCADGSGWMHWGQRFVPGKRATRADVINAFDLEGTA